MSIKTFNEYLTETSLSRVWSIFNTPENVAGIISASRKNLKPAVNAARTMDLARAVYAAGYGYVFADGKWVETENGERTPVQETSIIINGGAKDNGRLKGYLRKWMSEYDQEGVIFKPEGETYVIVMTEYGPETRIGRFHPDKVADMMTKLHGRGERSFVFESAWYSKNWFGRLVVDVQKREAAAARGEDTTGWFTRKR